MTRREFIKIMKRGDINNPEGLWKGTHGRGNYSYRKKHWLVYKLLFEAIKGKLGPGLECDHTCNVKGCVNWNHIEAVTHQVNVQRSLPQRTKLYCPRRHLLIPENTYVYIRRDGGVSRACKICRCVAQSLYMLRKEIQRSEPLS